MPWCSVLAGVGYALTQVGIESVFTGEPGAEDVQAVYVGWHPDCHMRDIEAACQAIWAGAKLYVASDVPFFATRHGKSMGYSYAIVGAIRRVTRSVDDSYRQAFPACASLHRQEAGRCGVTTSVSLATILPLRSSWRVKGGAVSFGVTTAEYCHEGKRTGRASPVSVVPIRLC